ncbi:MAG: hypothetical protein AAF652_10120 [Cyanobacteria bacterium P01_C01_bin.72]
MKSILALIQEKQQVYSQLPFFQFLNNKEIEPSQRLAFAPCATPFIMGFSDLCKYSLRQEPSNDPVQIILNKHTYEDDFHWQWFISDLEKLGFNYSLPLNSAIKFLWSEQTKVSRMITHKLHGLTTDGTAIERLIIMEAMESTADVLLSNTKLVAEKLNLITNLEYDYFGASHCDAEHDHNTNSQAAREFIRGIQIPASERERCADLVTQVFQLFTQWTYELLSFAQNHQTTGLLKQQSEPDLVLPALQLV